MIEISVKHIGPLNDTGVITITPVTLIIGEQSSGKSTLMKILCFCSWVEKHVMIDGDNFEADCTRDNRFRKELMKFHRLDETFFTDESQITYVGDAVKIELRGKTEDVKITHLPDFEQAKHNKKLCFLPAERNLLSSVQHIEKLYRTSEFDMLFNYILEWGEAKSKFTSDSPLNLPIARNINFFYDKGLDKEVVYLSDSDKKFSPFYASSGVQSSLPVSVMVNYLANIVGKEVKYSPSDVLNFLLREDEKLENEANLKSLVERLADDNDTIYVDDLSANLKKLQKILVYRRFMMFIEEPEQNLYPTSQFALLRSLISSLKKADSASDTLNSSIIMTTHSPYILTALNVLMKASVVYPKNQSEVNKIISADEILPISSYSAYYITPQGTIESLIDDEYHFIKGDELDSVSEYVDDYLDKLNDILYADN